ncbi:LPS export ABC transporter ATP-binding protein [Verrucomicrobiota bacterium]
MTETDMDTGNNSLLRAEGLGKVYHGRFVVNDVSLSVGRGEIVGLLGPNGAGKTTTFYMIVGLVRSDAGLIRFEGRDVTRLPVYRRARAGMGYLSQEPSVFRKLTVEENIMAVLETLRLSARQRRVRLGEMMEELGITRLAKQKAYTLSGGERRKLEITRAMVTEPSMIMLDEPFSGVDPIAVQDIQGIIANLRERGLGILITDHNVRETLAVVDRAYLLNDGKVLREGKSSFLAKDKMSRELYLGENFRM